MNNPAYVLAGPAMATDGSTLYVFTRPVIVWFDEPEKLLALFGRSVQWWRDRIGILDCIHAERINRRTRYYVHVDQADRMFAEMNREGAT